MPDVLIYSDTTYHITDGRTSIFQGEYRLREMGVYVEYPPEDVLKLSRKDKVNIKKAILEFLREQKQDSSNSYDSLNLRVRGHCEKARPVHLKFKHLG